MRPRRRPAADFAAPPIDRHLTLRELILEYVRDAIISGTLKGGSRVSEPEIARRYGISRTPIREAFRQLEAEGYLTVVPRRGALVSIFSQKDVEEFSTLISLLEGYAARCACGRLTDGELERLRDMNARMTDLAARNDIKNFIKANNEFHSQIIAAADNDKLRELLTNLVTRFQGLCMTMLVQPGCMEMTVMANTRLLEAFHERDADRAETLVRTAIVPDAATTRRTHAPRPNTPQRFCADYTAKVQPAERCFTT